MHITVRRSGGFAGLARTFAIDTATLPPARAAEIERLARALPPSRPSPDAFAYEVTVDGATIADVNAEALVEAMTGGSQVHRSTGSQ
jgi:hypothetical protein